MISLLSPIQAFELRHSAPAEWDHNPNNPLINNIHFDSRKQTDRLKLSPFICRSRTRL